MSETGAPRAPVDTLGTAVGHRFLFFPFNSDGVHCKTA